MKAAKVKRLQAAGWKVGNAEDFLESSSLVAAAPAASGVTAVRPGWYDGYQAAKDVDAWGKPTATEAIGKGWKW